MKEYGLKIEYPSDGQIENQVDLILQEGLPQKRKWKDSLKEYLIGPGLSVIFYRSKLILAESFLVYILLVYFFDFLGSYVENKEYLTILMFPMSYLIFHMLSYWAEEQDQIIELKESLYYPFQFVVSLRMFYVSIFFAMCNLVLMNGMSSFEQKGKLCMIGLSSLFLFAFLTIMLCEKRHGIYPVIISSGLWIFLCIMLANCGQQMSYLLFNVMPFVVHVLMFLFSFGLFIYYFGKVGEKYAYACEY